MLEFNENLIKFCKKLEESSEIKKEFIAKKNLKEQYEYAAGIQSGFSYEEFKNFLNVIAVSMEKISDEDLSKINAACATREESIAEVIAAYGVGKMLGNSAMDTTQKIFDTTSKSDNEKLAKEKISDKELEKVNGGINFSEIFNQGMNIMKIKNQGEELGKNIRNAFSELVHVIKATPEELCEEDELKNLLASQLNQQDNKN